MSNQRLEMMQTKEIETLSFMVEFQDARIAKLVDDNKRLTSELEVEKALVEAYQGTLMRLMILR